MAKKNKKNLEKSSNSDMTFQKYTYWTVEQYAPTPVRELNSLTEEQTKNFK